MSLGWVVVATDYVGLGTDGTELFLLGEAESRDVVNSERVARNLSMTAAHARFVVWGHAQGGHSSLWTGHLAKDLAPELNLLGVAAAAPAAELVAINRAQWDTPVGWAIGPEVAVAWPAVYPELQVEDVVSETGQSRLGALTNECIRPAGLEGLVRSELGQKFFGSDPTQQPQWASAGEAQTPPPLPSGMPAFIAQGLDDKVVLA
ncbi:lipase family protein [bacterium]|nr:lipase family protein [bacterium]